MSDPSFRERCDKAVDWLINNESRVRAALPLPVPGRTFKEGSVDSLLHWVDLWQQDGMTIWLAEAYLLTPIRLIYRELKGVKT